MVKFKKTACCKCGKVFEFKDGLFDKRPESGGFLFMKDVCFDCSKEKQLAKNNSNKVDLNQPKNNNIEKYSKASREENTRLPPGQALTTLVVMSFLLFGLLWSWGSFGGFFVKLIVGFGVLVLSVSFLMISMSSIIALVSGGVLAFLLYWSFHVVVWSDKDEIIVNKTDKKTGILSSEKIILSNDNQKVDRDESDRSSNKGEQVESRAKTTEELELEKQYSGDDPIVRQRLGLPPKN